MEKNDKERLDVIWNKGQVVKGYNEKCYRKDACGAWMIREKYGDRNFPLLVGKLIIFILSQNCQKA